MALNALQRFGYALQGNLQDVLDAEQLQEERQRELERVEQQRTALARLAEQMGGMGAVPTTPGVMGPQQPSAPLGVEQSLLRLAQITSDPTAILEYRIGQPERELERRLKLAQIANQQRVRLETFTGPDGDVYTVNPYTGETKKAFDAPDLPDAGPSLPPPQSALGKLYMDMQAGYLSPQDYQRAVDKETGAGGLDLRQEEVKAAGFLARMENALQELDALTELDQSAERAAQGPIGALAGAFEAIPSMGLGDSIGMGLKRFTASPAQQQYLTAADEFIRAKLRKESGAEVKASESQGEYRTYFPVPGDTPENISLKRRLRRQAKEAMRMEAGRAGRLVGRADGSAGVSGDTNGRNNEPFTRINWAEQGNQGTVKNENVKSWKDYVRK